MKLAMLKRVQAAREDGQCVEIVTDLSSHDQYLVDRQGVVLAGAKPSKEFERQLAKISRESAAHDLSKLYVLEGRRVFVQVFGPPYRLIVVGAVHISQHLLPMARMVGFEVHLVEPRTAFGSPERFPGMNINTSWPDQALEEIGLTARTAVVTLSHDPKIDEPALTAALGGGVFYIGALGSRKTHAKRLRRLAGLGVPENEFEKIHSPVGLPLGGRSPAEIAVAILAEIISHRYSADNVERLPA